MYATERPLQGLTNSELRAIYTYLQTVPAIEYTP